MLSDAQAQATYLSSCTRTLTHAAPAMITFAAIFAETGRFLETKGLAAEITQGDKATSQDIAQFQEQTSLVLPASFSAFHTGFANGFDFRWMQTEDVWGIFSLPSLEHMANHRQAWAGNINDFLDDPHSLDNCVKPRFRPAAFAIWRQMLSWVPLWNEEEGDHFCLDTTNGQILYSPHDWFDGFGSVYKTGGVVAGKDLADFIKNWSRFCFQPNKSLWWGEFAEFGAIKWESQYFHPQFCREI
ncbi:MAG: hypothetical protein ACO1QS_08335 [Verrucomicrobiota bacterium]